MAADQDDRQRNAAASQRLDQADPIHAARHPHIGDQAARLGRQPGEQRFGGGEADRDIAGGLQQQGQRVPHRGIVIHHRHEDAGRGHWGLVGCVMLGLGPAAGSGSRPG